MITDLLQLAATDPSSAAYKAGQLVGTIIGFVVMIGIPVLFILSLVKLITTKNKAWIIGLVLSGIAFILIICVFAVGAYMGYKNTKGQSLTETSSGTKKIVKVPDTKLSLGIPSHWKKIDDLNEAASLSMGNLFREEYLIVIAETKADFDGSLTDYSDLTVTAMIDSIDNSTFTEPVSLSINGLPAIQREFSGSVDRTKIAYSHTSIEGSENYYQIIGWTIPSRKTTAFKVIGDVVNSAKED